MCYAVMVCVHKLYYVCIFAAALKQLCIAIWGRRQVLGIDLFESLMQLDLLSSFVDDLGHLRKSMCKLGLCQQRGSIACSSARCFADAQAKPCLIRAWLLQGGNAAFSL